MEVIETIAAGKTRRLAEDGGVRNENRLSLYPPGWTNLNLRECRNGAEDDRRLS